MWMSDNEGSALGGASLFCFLRGPALYSPKPASPQLTQGRMTRMPERLTAIMDWLSSLPGPIKAFIAAVIIAPLRIMYDGSEPRWSRILLEAMLCGALAYGVASGADYFGVTHGMSVFMGSSIGFIGVVKFREFALAWVGKRVGR